MQLSTHFAV